MKKNKRTVKAWGLWYKKLYSKSDLRPIDTYKDSYGEEGQMIIFRKKMQAISHIGNTAWIAIPCTITYELPKKKEGKK